MTISTEAPSRRAALGAIIAAGALLPTPLSAAGYAEDGEIFGLRAEHERLMKRALRSIALSTSYTHLSTIFVGRRERLRRSLGGTRRETTGRQTVSSRKSASERAKSRNA